MKRSAFLALGMVFACSEAPSKEATSAPSPVLEVPDLVVDVATRRQHISGFGASSAWTAPTLSDELAEQFFSPETGLGLSLLRIQVRPEGNSFELATADLAVSYGARVWASPWSPPGELKTNGSSVGGALRPENYGTWAATLASFAASMQQRGTPLLGISAQNEPDYDAAWDSCVFTPTELADFVADHLIPALDEQAPDVRVVAPESANWNTLGEYGNALLDKPAAVDRLLAVATHDYGGSAFDFARVGMLGHELWMTETSDGNDTTPDTGMNSALAIASKLHVALTQANVSAWHYWWLLPRTDNIPDTNAGLTDPRTQLTKRAYALGHFSRFIRPDFVRVDTTKQLARQVMGSGYLSPDEQTLVVVLVSDKFEPLDQVVRVANMPLTKAELWVTDKDRSLERIDAASLSADASGTGATVHLTLPANSVLTLVLRTADAPLPTGGEGPTPAIPDPDRDASAATTPDAN